MYTAVQLANEISRYATERGKSVSSICTELSMSRSAISELKSGRRKSLNNGNIKKLADYFGITAGELLGLEKEIPAEKDESISEIINIRCMLDDDNIEILLNLSKKLYNNTVKDGKKIL